MLVTFHHEVSSQILCEFYSADSNATFKPKIVGGQWLKWKIRGEGTVYQIWAKMGPQQVVRDSIYEI